MTETRTGLICLKREQYDEVVATLNDIGEAAVAQVLQDAVVKDVEPGDVTWALNWYKTRRHIPKAGCKVGQDGSVKAYCSPYTTIFLNSHGSGRYAIPPANSEEVMATQPCKVCLKGATK